MIYWHKKKKKDFNPTWFFEGKNGKQNSPGVRAISNMR